MLHNLINVMEYALFLGKERRRRGDCFLHKQKSEHSKATGDRGKQFT